MAEVDQRTDHGLDEASRAHTSSCGACAGETVCAAFPLVLTHGVGEVKLFVGQWKDTVGLAVTMPLGARAVAILALVVHRTVA